ncbi:MAG: transglutaminase family protein [Chloroflexi bacterium]|nr:transglutaminase family protein [Chloroflexota bacterium]
MAAAAAVTTPALPYVVDWSRVNRIVYRVSQRFQYAYSEPVRLLHYRLLVVPPDAHADQRLLAHTVAMDGASDHPKQTWEQDGFGNRVLTVEAARADRALSFGADYLVERGAATAQHRAVLTTADLTRYLESTSLTEPNSLLARVAARLQASSSWPRGRAYRAYHWASAALICRPGVTDGTTSAAEAMALGAGACPDFTHVLLTVLRLMGIPSRYVSGHLLGNGSPHAWVEALFPSEAGPNSVSVVPYDPGNRREPGLSYITVAAGRDATDVVPVSGWFVGGTSRGLQADQRVEVTEVDYRSE